MSLLLPRQPVYLHGPAHHLPARVMSNEAILQWIGKEVRASWIEHRTGIQSRHWVQDDEACSDLGLAAARKLSEEFGADLSHVRQLLLGTVSGDYATPPTAPLIAHRLGLQNCGAADLAAACAGFVSGLHFASAMAIATGQAQLLINSEVRSKFLSKEQFNSAVLFGDGASAALVSANEVDAPRSQFRLLGSQLSSDGSVADLISIPAGGSRKPFQSLQDPLGADREALALTMKDGAAIFLKAVHGMQESAEILLRELKLTFDDIAWIVPHQANGMILKELGKRIPGADAKIVNIIGRTGNTSGASVGIALSHLLQRLRPSGEPAAPAGAKVLLVSAGGGGLAASAVLETL